MERTKAVGVGCIQMRSILFLGLFSGLSLLVLLSGLEAKAGCEERDSLECFFSLRDGTVSKKASWREECNKDPSKEGCKMVLLDMEIDGDYHQKGLPHFEIQIFAGYNKAKEGGCWGTFHSTYFIKLACACSFGKEAQRVLDAIRAKEGESDSDEQKFDAQKFKDACFSHYKIAKSQAASQDPCLNEAAPMVGEGALEVTRKGGILSRVKEAWADRRTKQKKDDQDSEPKAFTQSPIYKESRIEETTPPLSAVEEENLQREALARDAKAAPVRKEKFKLGEKIRERGKAALEKAKRILPSRRRGEESPADLGWNNGTHTNPLFVPKGHEGNMPPGMYDEPHAVERKEREKGVLKVSSDFKRPSESQLDRAIDAVSKSENARKPVLKRADSAAISDEQIAGLSNNQEKAAKRRAAEKNLAGVPSIEEARKNVEAREEAKKQALAKAKVDEEAEYQTKLADQKAALKSPYKLLDSEEKVSDAIKRAERLGVLEKKRGGLESGNRTAELGRLKDRLEDMRNRPKDSSKRPSEKPLEEIKKLKSEAAVKVLNAEMPPANIPNEINELKNYIKKVRSYLRDGQEKGNLSQDQQADLHEYINSALNRRETLLRQKTGNLGSESDKE